ncbi:Uncharacterised protein [uncultured archaeon]|nr:Uncharacterised protein [uncultured archaeon]
MQEQGFFKRHPKIAATARVTTSLAAEGLIFSVVLFNAFGLRELGDKYLPNGRDNGSNEKQLLSPVENRKQLPDTLQFEKKTIPPKKDGVERGAIRNRLPKTDTLQSAGLNSQDTIMAD